MTVTCLSFTSHFYVHFCQYTVTCVVVNIDNSKMKKCCEYILSLIVCSFSMLVSDGSVVINLNVDDCLLLRRTCPPCFWFMLGGCLPGLVCLLAIHRCCYIFVISCTVLVPGLLNLFFSCLTQLRLNFILLINVKLPTIVGIITFISRIN